MPAPPPSAAAFPPRSGRPPRRRGPRREHIASSGERRTRRDQLDQRDRTDRPHRFARATRAALQVDRPSSQRPTVHALRATPGGRRQPRRLHCHHARTGALLVADLSALHLTLRASTLRGTSTEIITASLMGHTSSLRRGKSRPSRSHRCCCTSVGGCSTSTVASLLHDLRSWPGTGRDRGSSSPDEKHERERERERNVEAEIGASWAEPDRSTTSSPHYTAHVSHPILSFASLA